MEKSYMKPTFEIVLSAPQWGIYPNKDLNKLPKEKIRELINGYAEIMHRDVNVCAKSYIPKISVMYNAFSEIDMLDYFGYYGTLGFKNVYSDSGGLQIITRGCQITSEIKDQIYTNQMYSDYAFCFDVIKVSKIANIAVNERSQAYNKIFHQGEHKEAGYLTGQNIKRQIEFFRRNNAKTKVLIIVQGNRYDDMLVYFNEIEKQLSEDDYNYIGGYATAYACIGQGEIEVVETLRAAREIGLNSHKNVADHLHLLGIGATTRLAPALYLKKSGFLKNNYISFDSSKICQTFTIGQVLIDGKISKLGKYRNRLSDQHFKNVYNVFSDCLNAKGFSQKYFLDILFGDNSYSWSSARVNHNAIATKDEWKVAVSYLYRAIHSFYQVINFNKNIEGIMDGSFNLGDKYLFIQNLENVHDDKDLLDWFGHQKQTNKTRSKRIKREEEIFSLESFLN